MLDIYCRMLVHCKPLESPDLFALLSASKKDNCVYSSICALLVHRLYADSAARHANPTAPSEHWQDQVFPILKAANIKHIAYVPDAGHSRAITAANADPDVKSVVLTTEEEGLGYLAGAWLGGERGALLLQSSGVGNCINTLGLQAGARFPLLMLVTMRGDWAEFNPWQNPMGQATEEALKLMGVMTWRADKSADVADLIKGAITMAFDGDTACAVILGQRLIGEKEWGN